MKLRNQFSVLTLIAVIMLIPALTIAQPQNRQGQRGNPEAVRPNRPERMVDQLPDLSDTQKDQMKMIHQQVAEQMIPLNNQINEKEARLQTLQTTAVSDMKAINQGIDELSKLKAQSIKLRAKAHQDIRKLLTDEQRVMLDNHFQNRMNRPEPGKGNRGGRR